MYLFGVQQLVAITTSTLWHPLWRSLRITTISYWQKTKKWYTKIPDSMYRKKIQILFSFSSDKERRTDSRIRRENTAQPHRESNPGFCEFPAGCTVCFRLIRLSVLLSLSELKEKRIWLGMIPTRASLRRKKIVLKNSKPVKLSPRFYPARKLLRVALALGFLCSVEPQMQLLILT